MKRSPLTRKTPLVRKTPLQSRSTLKRASLKATGPKKRKTLEQKTKPELIKEADKWYSRYVRLRDSDKLPDGSWAGLCIDGCGKLVPVMSADGRWLAGSNIGHYVGRASKNLRFDDFNCNLQAAWCNAWRDKISMLNGYRKGLDMKYGTGTATRLKREGNKDRKLSKDELLEIIADSKEYIAYALKNPDKYTIIG